MKLSNGWLISGLLVSILACGGQRTGPASDPFATFDPGQSAAGAVLDFRPIYNRMGLTASPPPIGFVGSSAFFASQTPDTTLAVVSISIPNRGLTFERDGDEYKATYEVVLTARQEGATVAQNTARETVRVGTHEEVGRTDESIVFRQVMKLAPGTYTLSYIVRDVAGARDAGEDETIHVPYFGGTAISRPVVIYDGDKRTDLQTSPDYLASPRAALEFGVDSTIGVYIEAYSQNNSLTVPISLMLRDSGRAPVWADTLNLAVQGGIASGVIDIPLAAADIGIWNLVAKRVDTQDSSRASVFIGFGPDLPVLTFREMVEYLRYFARNSELQALYNATPETRGAVWSAFLKATDPSPQTPQNEALQEYFLRIRDANFRFRSDGPQGWRTDRGSVYVGLGAPSAVYQDEGYLTQYSLNPGQKVRVMIWEYHQLQGRIIFVDELWSGQWKFLPSSESQFRTLLSRVVSSR